MRAVIDIGSNSVRLMIDRGLKLNPKKLAATRLGGGLVSTGRIDAQAFSDSVRAVAGFCREAAGAGADEIYVFATEAVRAAANGADFCRAVKEATGIDVDVVDGETEARLAYLGAAGARGRYTVIDAGGASTEITTGADGKVLASVSVKTGAVRLKSLRLSLQETAACIDGLLTDIPAVCGTVLAVGGTATALAAADLGLQTYDAQKVHGHTVTLPALERLLDAFGQGDIVGRFPAVTRSRAEILPYGALIYERLMRRTGTDAFTVSETDNCEGYLAYKAQHAGKKPPCL